MGLYMNGDGGWWDLKRPVPNGFKKIHWLF